MASYSSQPTARSGRCSKYEHIYSCECCYFHERNGVSEGVCVGELFDHKSHADLWPWMLYIVNFAHTYMPLLCKGVLCGVHATKEHVLVHVHEDTVLWEIGAISYSFVMTLCSLWGIEETQGSNRDTDGQTETVILCCFVSVVSWWQQTSVAERSPV